MSSPHHGNEYVPAESSRVQDPLVLGVFLAVVIAAAALGAIFKPGAWYAGLLKPSWTPPNAVLAPVWSVLYLLIAVAGWLVWRSGDRGMDLLAWGAGIALNASWSWLFFGQNWIGPALLDIAMLWITILAFIGFSRRVNPVASWLFVPYFLWVGLAALNFEIWRLNA